MKGGVILTIMSRDLRITLTTPRSSQLSPIYNSKKTQEDKADMTATSKSYKTSFNKAFNNIKKTCKTKYESEIDRLKSVLADNK